VYRVTTAPVRLIQVVKDIVRALSRHYVQHAVAGGMVVSTDRHPRGTKDVKFLIDSGGASGGHCRS
jgi:hypothetical protein